MDITPFIRELILLNECVILRGIGGFETSYRHAMYRKDKKILIPPNKKIHFQPNWIKDNGILEDYLAKSLKISNELASEYIDNYVQEFHNQMRKNGKVILEGIGEFVLDKENKIQFNELEDANYLADSFGLDIVEIEPDIKQEGKSVKTEMQPITLETRKLTGWYVAIGVLLLLISITFIILFSQGEDVSLFNINRDVDSESEVVVFGTSPDPVADSIARSIEETLNQKTNARNALTIEKTTRPENKNQILAESSSKQVIYYLVAGSFKNFRNAEILKDQLVRKGFSAKVLDSGGSQYRVIVGSYNNRKQAIEELRRIRIQLDQSVWLLEMR